MINEKDFIEVLNNYKLSREEIANFSSKICRVSKHKKSDCMIYSIISPQFIPNDVFVMAVDNFIKTNNIQNIDGKIEFSNKGGARIAKFTVMNVPYSKLYTINKIANTNTYAITYINAKVTNEFLSNFIKSLGAVSYSEYTIESLKNTIFVSLNF